MSGQDGALRITDLATGACHALISIGLPGSTFGNPVEAARRVYVPNFGTGTVVIIEPGPRHSHHHRRVHVTTRPDAPHRFRP